MPRECDKKQHQTHSGEQSGLIIMSSFPTGQIMKIDCTGKKLFYFIFLQNSLKINWVWHYFSICFSSQSNWYDMNAGNFNLLLIKTCCWHWLLTDNNLELSCSQFYSSPLLCFLFPPCYAASLIFLSTLSFSLLLDCTLFYITVSPPWRGKESPPGRNHCPQQPPHGGEDHNQ